MRITALGHAGLKVEAAGATVLVDPWVSPEGAFQASWFPFPDNAHLVEPSMFEPTAIVISHEHLDHLDPWFLSRVPPTVPVVIPRYPSPVLRRKIEESGPRPIVEAPPWERVELAQGMTVFFVSEESPMNHDSAVVIQAGGRTLLNLNDARLFPVQFRAIRTEIGGDVDVFSFQGAGASWYPMSYRYPSERRRELSRQKRLAKLAYAARAVEVVEPRLAVPFAGPPCFLDPELRRHNEEIEDGIFPHQQQVTDWLKGRGISNALVLLPGDAWDAEARVKDPDPCWEGFRFGDWRPYVEAYAERRRSSIEAVRARHPDPDGSLRDQFHGYFERLLEMSPYFNERIGMRVGFDVSGSAGGRWAVDFRSGDVGDDLGDCAYIYRVEARWLQPILEGAIPWEDFFLSLRFEAWREPDLYNDHLLGLLKFADRDALEAVEAFERSMTFDERITIQSGSKRYRISRYCPHAGNDLLQTGEVLEGGIIRCLAHHYEFDLESGACVNGSCPPLDVEPDASEGVPWSKGLLSPQ